MKSGAYSDLKLACHGQEFSVHKMVVCSQSRVLAAAVNGEFEVCLYDWMKEAQKLTESIGGS